MANNFDTLVTAVIDRIEDGFKKPALWPPNGASLAAITVLAQDYADITTKINIAIGKIGMLCLINMPDFKNDTPVAPTVNGRIHFIIEVGEQPVIWRDNPLTKPTAKSVAQIVAQLLQGWLIPGFQPLRVLSGDFSSGKDKANKERQVYSVNIETLQIFPSVTV